MRRFILVMMCVLATACSDDSPSNGNNTTNNSTNNSTNNTSNNTNNTNGNNTTNNTNSGIDAGADVSLDMAEVDMGVDAEADAESDAEMFPDLGQDPCAFPTNDANCPQGPYGPASFMTSIIIPETATCCFDYNGDGVIDNKIGQLLATARNLGFDVNNGVAQAIEAGELVNIFGFSNFGNAEYDPTLDVVFLKGTDSDFDFAPNLLGLGDFYVLVESLNTQSQPKWTFGSARVRAGVLEAYDGEFDLDFPDLLDQVRIPVVQGRVKATVLPGAEFTAGGRVTLDEGELGGVVLRDEFFDSLNDASIACSCLSRAVYDRQPNGGYVCNSSASDANACAGMSSGCQFLASSTYCGLLGTAISNAVDVDTDGDNVPDSYSFGATFTGVGAKVLGNQ